MKEWSDRLTGALGNDPGSALLVKLSYGIDGMEFERRLGMFIAQAAAFRDAREFMLSTSDLTYANEFVRSLARRDNLTAWMDQVDISIEHVFQVVHETLYDLFGDPMIDVQRASASYTELLSRVEIAPPGANWVYATTNYDRIGDEALAEAGFPVDWGEPRRVRAGDRQIRPDGLLRAILGTVPVLHLHGRIGWYRRRESEGGGVYSADMVQHQDGFGAPIVMLPSPKKLYEGDDVIESIWNTFEEALARARRVLVLGHSLNDDQIVSAITDNADPATVGVTVYAHQFDPEQPERNDDPIIGIQKDRLPEATLIPIRFGEEGAVNPVVLDRWAEKFR